MQRHIKKNLKDQQISLKDLLNIKEWQKIQDNFAAITDVCLRTVDPNGKFITSISKEPRLCSELLQKSPQKEKICGSCLPTFLGGRATVDKNLSFICHAGLHNFLTPLRTNGSVFGYIIAGPVILIKRKSKEGYSNIAEQFNLELEDFWKAILEIKVMSFHGVQSLVELVKDVCEYSIRLAYQNVIEKKEAVMALDSHKLSRLLNALLDVAFQITQADIGSIMFLDKDREDLTIRASKGLPEDIVNKTRVRLGDGIAGTAAKERVSFLIDDNLRDNRIKDYLRRPSISSSMVIPIQVKNRVFGVVNLGALQTSPVRFTANNMQLMNRLIDLATVALQD
jgi:ligand-binding sensor protein